jgi:pyruvate carboxylase
MSIGVPVVPGTPGPIAKYEDGAAFVAEHGFPVIIKAALGGGGRGMRVVRAQSEFKDAFQMAVSEAKAAFGDGTVFIERFLDKPKHIEAQLLGDSAGNVVHLFERDCSVQRRHQKVVEQGPAGMLSEELRNTLLADAIKIAKAVNYRNAGTVSLRFLFREMQVLTVPPVSSASSWSTPGVTTSSRSTVGVLDVVPDRILTRISPQPVSKSSTPSLVRPRPSLSCDAY